ncbi:protein kinase domain protein [Ichthyophthirius multifiliis]|uniref:Protein kinase domain protein n=1 Tax=Ichthyophthirius multifiliis TaxID=5932 RepID=G0QKH9_ICHMU|nr:protein kinase domain protein [Ichthyophthirius multifiliis]EGR34275.1 protein kinase domain protein [Ichthyophthirius multifiliis]|eukprot:XP_004039579.1 protein kinase domain protein [Ichthyophthirius multifiliis]
MIEQNKQNKCKQSFIILKKRRIKLVKNGDPAQIINCLIKQHINFDQLENIIIENMQLSKDFQGQIRVFKVGGIEILNEDVQYIKNNDILYVSEGQEFDESSNFAIYKIIRVLGEGGFGKVYKAKNRITKQCVAIKMIEWQKIKNAKETEMIFKELVALKNLNHNNIVKVYNCFTLHKTMSVALILEYLDGGDLRSYLDDSKIIKEDEAQKLFYQLHSAIYYCHREGIIHRDLKLENIMFNDQNHKIIKVVDFGISGKQSLINIDYTEAGTVRYLAPEVIKSHAPAHPSIDVWALGCILFWILTGNSPFNQKQKEAIQENIVKGKWEFQNSDKKRLTKSVQDLIKKCLLLIKIKELQCRKYKIIYG